MRVPAEQHVVGGCRSIDYPDTAATELNTPGDFAGNRNQDREARLFTSRGQILHNEFGDRSVEPNRLRVDAILVQTPLPFGAIPAKSVRRSLDSLIGNPFWILDDPHR